MLSATHLIGFGAGGVGGRGLYPVDYSCRFNPSDGADIKRIFKAGNRRTATFSTWFKRGSVGTQRAIAHFGTGGDGIDVYFFSSNDAVLDINYYISGPGHQWRYITTQVFRDPHAWQHLVIEFDLNHGTASERVRIHINGARITAFSAPPSDSGLNAELHPDQYDDQPFNNTNWISTMAIGELSGNNPTSNFDGYQAQTVWIDGTALAPTSFAEFDNNGVWRPKDVSGLIFGTNGVYLNYAVNPGTGMGAGTDISQSPVPDAPAVTLPPIHFATDNDYLLRGDDLTGSEDTKVGIYSLWIRSTGDTGPGYILANTNALSSIYREGNVAGETLGTLKVHGYDTADPQTVALELKSLTPILPSDGWVHYCGSWDLGNGIGTMYRNGVDDLAENPILDDAVLDHTRPEWSIGGYTQPSFSMFIGDLAQVYYNITETIDLTDADNLAKFITTGCEPVDMGATGSTPTGTSPIIFMNSPLATWETNDGTGGGFTLAGSGETAGTITAGTGPVVCTNIGNHFTEAGLEPNDRVTDTPTNNFMTISSLSKFGGDTLADGNLVWSDADASGEGMVGSMWITSGKWYWEVTIDALTDGSWVGVWGGFGPYASTAFSPWNSNNDIAGDHGTWVIKPSTGYVIDGDGQGNPGTNAYLSDFLAEDVISFALDMDEGAGSNKLWIGKNGTWETNGDPDSGAGEIFNNLPAGVTIVIGNRGSGPDTYTFNFGSSTAGFTKAGNIGNIVGFNALNTTNLPVPAIKDNSVNVQAHAYEGTGQAHIETLTGNSNLISTDIGYIKNRDETDSPHLVSFIRSTSNPGAYIEQWNDPGGGSGGGGNVTEQYAGDGPPSYGNVYGVTDLGDENTFALGSGADGWNDDNENFASIWWYTDGTIGASDHAGSDDGDITSTLAVNTASGVVSGTYVGNGDDNQTVGHGLPSTLGFLFIKNLTNTEFPRLWHKGLSSTLLPSSGEPMTAHYRSAGTPTDDTTIWSGVEPNGEDNTFKLGTSESVNGEDDIHWFMGFCDVPGATAIITYQGNNSSTDGPLLLCDFTPTVAMFFRQDVSTVLVMDRMRSPSNVAEATTRFMHSHAENAAEGDIDWLANGVKLRDNAQVNGVDNSDPPIGAYHCAILFAEHPFGGHGGTFGSGVSPATAR